MSRSQPDGRLAKLIANLRQLIDEGSNFAQIALKYRALTGLASKKHSVEKMLGETYWARLQPLLAKPAARAVLEQHKTERPRAKSGRLVGA